MKIGRMLGALVLAGAMALCSTGCEPIEEASESVYEETTEPAPEMLNPYEVDSIIDALPTIPEDSVEIAVPTEADTGDEGSAAGVLSTFGKGVFLGRSMEDWEERFFCFTDGGNGTCMAQEDGKSENFTVVMEDTEHAVFRFAESGDSKAELFKTDDKSWMLLWEDGESEMLTKVSDEPAGFTFLSNEVLCGRAIEIYEEKTGYRPSLTEAIPNADATIAIKLYDDVDGHNATSEWYTVNRYTGIGTNIMGEEVNLGSGQAAPVVSAADSTEAPEETEPAESQEESSSSESNE